MARQPSRDDPSKPKQHGYEYKKQFYQSSEVAADYDELVAGARAGVQRVHQDGRGPDDR